MINQTVLVTSAINTNGYFLYFIYTVEIFFQQHQTLAYHFAYLEIMVAGNMRFVKTFSVFKIFKILKILHFLPKLVLDK